MSCEYPGCGKTYCGCTCPNCMVARRNRKTMSDRHCHRHSKGCHWS